MGRQRGRVVAGDVSSSCHHDVRRADREHLDGLYVAAEDPDSHRDHTGGDESDYEDAHACIRPLDNHSPRNDCDNDCHGRHDGYPDDRHGSRVGASCVILCGRPCLPE